MGFPTWTLVGMGATAVGALIAIALAYIGQSPRLIRQFGLAAYRFDLRVRSLTGYALALLLLAFGFFLAGVPLAPAAAPLATPTSAAAATLAFPSPPPEATLPAATITVAPAADAVSAGPDVSPTAPTPVSGAFGARPPTATPTPLDPDAPTPTPDATATDGPSPTPSNTPTPSRTPTLTPTPTPTASPTPTFTPSPTPTPTPIVGQTATIDTLSSTLWIRRTPGGSRMILVLRGDVVIVRDGHANHGGALWQEVQALSGEVGWVPQDFLDYGAEGPP